MTMFGAALLALSLAVVTGCDTKGPATDAKGTPGASEDKSPPRAGKTKAGNDPPAKNPEFKTTAEALVKEFLAGDKAALAKYKNKVVEIDGSVLFANQIIGADRITLTGAKKNPTDIASVDVSCILSSAGLEKAWWLGRGQKVKVVGKVVDYTSTFGVFLGHCTVAEAGANPTPKVTAEALVEEFVNNPEAAEKKYTESEYVKKEVIVEGIVHATEARSDGFYFVILAGKDGSTVSFTVDKNATEELKKGDKVTLKGDLSLFDKNKKQLTVNTAFVLKKE
jgi:hypothetical protein